MKDLTESQRGAIIYGYQHGDSLRTIAAAVGCCKSSVGNVVEEYKRLGAEAQKKKKAQVRQVGQKSYPIPTTKT